MAEQHIFLSERDEQDGMTHVYVSLEVVILDEPQQGVCSICGDAAELTCELAGEDFGPRARACLSCGLGAVLTTSNKWGHAVGT